MQRQSIVALSLACVFFAALGCEEQGTLETDKQEQSLLQYANQGEANYGEIVKTDLLGGDFGHFYSYTATAGENMAFVLEWHEPESVGLGVELWVENSNRQIIASDYSFFDTKAHVDVTFPEDGVYRIFISHYFWGWFGRYPYLFGTEPHLCADLTMVSTAAEYEGLTFYEAKNFAPGERDAWSWFPVIGEEAAASMVVLERNVTLGHCKDIIDFSCQSDDPQVCGQSVVGGELYDNECAFRTDFNSAAGTDSSAFGWYAEYPECLDIMM